MEISSDHIVELIQGQARIEQAVKDMKDSTTKGMTFLNEQHGKLDKRVAKVEKKVWFGAGAASIVGFVAGYFKH